MLAICDSKNGFDDRKMMGTEKLIVIPRNIIYILYSLPKQVSLQRRGNTSPVFALVIMSIARRVEAIERASTP